MTRTKPHDDPFSSPEQIAVVTGDPSLPDPTRHGHRYGRGHLKVPARKREAFATRGNMDFEVFERHEGLFDALRCW